MADMNSTSTGESQNRPAQTSPTSTPEGNGDGDQGIVRRVRERAVAELSTQKNVAFDGIGSVAQAVRQSTQHLREQQHDTLAGYVEQAADQIERFAQQLRGKDVSELFDDAQQLARRQPAIFIGSAFALGLIGARFFKSSPRDRHHAHPDNAYRRDRTDFTNRSSAGTTTYATRPASPSVSSVSGSTYGRDTAANTSSAGSTRTTTETAGERQTTGQAVPPAREDVSGATQPIGRSRRVGSATERAK